MDLLKAPSTKIQAPEKLQGPNSKTSLGRGGVGACSLVLLRSLDLGAWSFLVRPHPIRFVWRALLRWYAAVIFFVPADGVEKEAAIVGAPIFEGLSADEIVRKFVNELRQEQVEFFGIFAM